MWRVKVSMNTTAIFSPHHYVTRVTSFSARWHSYSPDLHSAVASHVKIVHPDQLDLSYFKYHYEISDKQSRGAHVVYIATPHYGTSLFIKLFARHWANNDSVKSLRNMLYVVLGH